MKRAQPERQLQKAVAEYLSHALPPDAFFSSIPGGEGRATRTPGYRAGLPDMVVIFDGVTQFIELKSTKGRASIEQQDCAFNLYRAGARVTICRSLKDVQSTLSILGIPLRTKVAA